MTELWQRRLRPPSFRGIPFKVESHEYKFGRNAAAHEAAGESLTGSGTYTEDTGKKVDVFTIEAYVIGENYFALRDALITACKIPGPGLLIHPYHGAKNVQCAGIVEREVNDEGRIARFTLTFYEKGEASFPFSVFDKVTSFFDAAIVAAAALQNVFVEAFSLLNMPGFVIDSAASAVNAFADAIDTAIDEARTTPSLKAQIKQSTNNLRNAIDRIFLDNEKVELASTINSILNEVRDIVPVDEDNFTVDISTGRDDRLYIFRNLISFSAGSEDVTASTATREQEKQNLEAFENLVKSLSLIKLSENSVNREWVTRSAADEQRNKLIDLIDNALLSLSDEAFQGLEDFKSWLVQVLPNPENPLSSVKEYDLTVTLPSIMLSYELYNSADKEIDLIKRNNVRNPAFMSGQLEVLSSG